MDETLMVSVVYYALSRYFATAPAPSLECCLFFSNTDFIYYGYLPLFAELLKLIRHKLYLCTYDNLYRSFSWADYAGNACGLNLLFIDSRVIFNFQAESCNTVVNGGNIRRASDTFQDNSCHFSKVVIGQNHLGFVLVVLTSGVFKLNLTIINRNTI